jgi:hypothetical protein
MQFISYFINNYQVLDWKFHVHLEISLRLEILEEVNDFLKNKRE